ncbi:HAMP domain-containing sensor histidine kinase [Halorussus sp. MSC15.2]|uniref:sensor histidine kinase n=1 Tax=Halorussus sp. MSC15.2 TaxID=2283638 RepID=UPI0013D09C70|nr:HAMP domain-containing sensor histidine kinase [Halorussus sp. MSC15.2]NEU57004.1 HAMP domain-containing histidine kinase [Halorussus sp. MSC15.2]
MVYEFLNVFSPGFLGGFVVSMIFVSALLGGAYWLDRTDIPTERYLRIAKWVVGGMVFFFAINLVIMAISNTDDLAFQFSWGRWAANVGAAGGLLVGYVEARAIQRELEAQRAEIRAEEAESQRRWLDYLNGLLRHEVLNSANIITGYASILLDDDTLDDTTEAHLATIHRQGRNMTNVIRDVQVLLETTSEPDRLKPMNLSDVLADELDQLRDTYESVTVEASIPDDVTVLADDLLARVFSNLFRNAVEHDDSERPAVRVTVEETGDTVLVRVADDGPGIPANDRGTLFERSDNTGASHGLGLYLVRTLAERYDGRVELTETGSDGSVFTVELSTTDRDTDETAPVEEHDPVPRPAQ